MASSITDRASMLKPGFLTIGPFIAFLLLLGGCAVATKGSCKDFSPGSYLHSGYYKLAVTQGTQESAGELVVTTRDNFGNPAVVSFVRITEDGNELSNAYPVGKDTLRIALAPGAYSVQACFGVPTRASLCVPAEIVLCPGSTMKIEFTLGMSGMSSTTRPERMSGGAPEYANSQPMPL